MTTATLTVFALSQAAWVISIIAILIVAVLAWREFGGKEDVER